MPQETPTRPATAQGSTAALRALIPVSFLVMIVALYTAFLYAPTERIEGDIQRMFYIHVPAAITMYVAFSLVFLASLMYLLRRDARWDEVAASAAEVGTLFATTVILTGPMWARPVWGVWWVWDARLTSTFVLWLIYVAYMMLRVYGGPADQIARFCAVLAIIGFLDLPIIHYSVTWWRTLHPEPKVMTQGSLGGGVEPVMLACVGVGLLAALALFATLFTLRLRLERSRRTAAALYNRAVAAQESRA